MDKELERKREVICEAIVNRRIIEFDYHGEHRVVEPYICGIGVKDTYQLSGFQIEGKSPSNPRLGWRKFALADIVELVVTPRNFLGWGGDRHYYNPGDKSFKEMFCRISK